MSGYTAKEIKESKREALEKIKKFLDVDDVDGQFENRTGEYYSADKFIVTWKANFHGYACEQRIDKCDNFYAMYSGYKAIHCTVGLLHEKQIKGYTSIERALIDVGISFCSKEEKQPFFDKYATRYNERINKLQQEKT